MTRHPSHAVNVLLVAIAVVMLLAGCTGAPEQEHAAVAHDYPEARYLTATGSADNPEAAANRALANLARIFHVAVAESSDDRSQAVITRQDEATQINSEEQYRRTVRTFTDQQLQGARIARRWQDDSGRHYALAVLSRERLARQLRQQITAQDQHTQALVGRARSAEDPWRAARLFAEARQVQINRARLHNDLRIVDRTGSGMPPRWTVASLDTAIRDSLGQLTVQPVVTRDPLGKLPQQLAAATEQMGLASSAGSNWQLQAALELAPVEQRDGWYWYRGNLEVQLQDPSAAVRAIQRWPLKAAGATRSVAEGRLQDQVTDLLQASLRDALLQAPPEDPAAKP